MIVGFSFLSMFSFACYAEKQNEEFTVINMPYHKARKIILQNGWKPTSAFQNKLYEEDREKYGYVHPFLKLGYQELGTCTEIGMAYCDFYFENQKNQYFRIITQGEDNGPEAAAQTRVIYMGIIDSKNSSFKNKSMENYWYPIDEGGSRSNFKALKEILKK